MIRRLVDNPLLRLTGKKKQYGKTAFGNRFLPQPSEAYCFWDLYTEQNFSRSYLHDQVADSSIVQRMHRAIRHLLLWQGRTRFTAKMTGPPRITFLNSIFPDLKFVHIVRDGRAAVHSLFKVTFWREKGGFCEPFWTGGLSDEDLRLWQDNERDPGVLAALQWKRIMEISRAESQFIHPSRYVEIRYEDFVEAPHATLRRIYEFCDLDDSPLGHEYLNNCEMLVNLNDKDRSEFSVKYIEKLTALMEPVLQQLNYSETTL